MLVYHSKNASFKEQFHFPLFFSDDPTHPDIVLTPPFHLVSSEFNPKDGNLLAGIIIFRSFLFQPINIKKQLFKSFIDISFLKIYFVSCKSISTNFSLVVLKYLDHGKNEVAGFVVFSQ